MLKITINDNLPAMGLTKPFNEIGKNDAETAGGKGASLGEMTQAGIPVPPGFVVLADAFEQFIKETGLIVEIDSILDTVDHQAMHTVENASEQIQALILGAQMPDDLRTDIEASFAKLGTEFVAVRSSATAEDGATAAWAGQLDTYLNTTHDTLLENVQRCWASLFTPRAIFYRFEKELHTQKISVAVVVQKMVNSDAAGIAFSVHPVTEDYNQMIIEAGFGLGEAVVSGQVTPDGYVVTKEPREILEKSVSEQSQGLFRKAGGGNEWITLPPEQGSKQVLSDEQILALAETLIGIERHYGFPVDTEWAVEGDEVFIVQSRPITTLQSLPLPKSGNESDHPSVLDYELTFEGQGMEYLYEVALYKYYLPHDSVSIIKRGVVQEFMSKKTLARMDKEGLDLTAARIRELMGDMDAAVTSARTSMEDILANPLTPESLRQAFVHSGAVTHAYYFFDPHFFDSLFERSLHSPADKEAVDLVQEYKNKAREDFNDIHFGNGYIPRLLEKLAEISGVSRENLGQYNEEELAALLDGQIVSEAVLSARKDIFAMRKDQDGILTFLEGEEAKEFANDFYVNTETPGRETIRGKGAHVVGDPIRGFVCIITRDYNNVSRMYEEMAAMKEGDILVTQTTDPEMMPALRKAGAAVTDIGGMLSHTAITARELNIPCIVDTKVATQVLKNGDEIEVDAKAGTVRIITSDRPTILSKIFGREKPLFYFALWQADDKKALKVYLDYDLKNDLFIVPPPGQSGSIWYSNEEFEKVSQLALETINASDEYAQSLIDHAKKYWELIRPYLVDKKRCDTAEEMYTYYENLVDFWMPMNSFYFLLPDRAETNPVFKEGILAVREVTQEYTEEMPRVFVDFFTKRFPDLAHLAYYCTPEEAVRLDKNLDPELIKELEDRARGGCYMFEGEIYHLDTLDTVLADHNLALERIETEGMTEIKGQTAYKGLVTGPVCLILSKSDAKKVKQGDILVTAMTNPDYVPVMKIAGAVVTDEGGLTCHAAIASREMQVPCVIATKVATQLLKDGDMVEVDATNGVVRILK